MTMIMGEYPYYRARKTDWATDLARLHAEGIEVVSFYIPWRLHESLSGDIDFSGEEIPNADLNVFFDLLRAEGLTAVVKPGPFIHAEVRYGGLPDRIIHSRNTNHIGNLASFGIGFGDDPPLSPADPDFLREATAWLEVVRDRLIQPNADLIMAVQIGNEGVFSDAAKPTDHPRRYTVSPIGEVLSRFSKVFADVHVKRYINLPLPDPGIADHLAYDWWVTRVLPMVSLTDAVGYTAWAGPISISDAALARTLLASHHFDMGCVEENWGHVWSGPHYRSPEVLLHHSIFSLALGSPTQSIYTACSTNAMDPYLQPTTTDLLAEGMEPAAFAGTYCPFAPIAAGGQDGETLHGLRRLVALRKAIDATGTEWAIDYDLDVIIEPTAAFITWQVAELVKDLFVRHKIHARVLFSATEDADVDRPTVHIEAADDRQNSDDLRVAVRHDRESGWLALKATEMNAEVIWRVLHLTSPVPALVSTSICRVRWVACDGSGARLDFIFNRSSEKTLVHYGIEPSSEGASRGTPFTVEPYDVLVLWSESGVNWEEICTSYKRVR